MRRRLRHARAIDPDRRPLQSILHTQYLQGRPHCLFDGKDVRPQGLLKDADRGDRNAVPRMQDNLLRREVRDHDRGVARLIHRPEPVPHADDVARVGQFTDGPVRRWRDRLIPDVARHQQVSTLVHSDPLRGVGTDTRLERPHRERRIRRAAGEQVDRCIDDGAGEDSAPQALTGLHARGFLRHRAERRPERETNVGRRRIDGDEEAVIEDTNPIDPVCHHLARIGTPIPGDRRGADRRMRLRDRADQHVLCVEDRELEIHRAEDDVIDRDRVLRAVAVRREHARRHRDVRDGGGQAPRDTAARRCGVARQVGSGQPDDKRAFGRWNPRREDAIDGGRVARGPYRGPLIWCGRRCRFQNEVREVPVFSRATDHELRLVTLEREVGREV